METCPADSDKYIKTENDQVESKGGNPDEAKGGDSEVQAKAENTESQTVAKEENKTTDNSDKVSETVDENKTEMAGATEGTENTIGAGTSETIVTNFEDQKMHGSEPNGGEISNSNTRPDMNGTSAVNGINGDEVPSVCRNGRSVVEGKPEISEQDEPEMAETGMLGDDFKEKQVSGLVVSGFPLNF